MSVKQAFFCSRTAAQYERKSQMSEYNSVNEEIRAQSDKIKKQPFSKRAGYFWYYHKWQLIAAVCAALLVGSIAKTILSDSKTIYLTGVFLNTRLTEPERETLIGEYAAAQGIDTDKYAVDFNCSLAYNLEDPSDSVSIYTPVSMVAYSEGCVGDFVLTDAGTFDFFAKSGYYADLSEALDASLLKRYEDRFYYYDALDGRGTVPMAIDISDSPRLASLGYPEDDGVLFSLFFNSGKKEHALAFLAWLYEE